MDQVQYDSEIVQLTNLKWICFILKYEDLMSYGDMVLFSATSNGDVQRVRGLIDMGRKINGLSTMAFDAKTFTDVTALHVAIFKKHPDILACLLQAKNSDEAMKIKCKEGKNIEYSPLQLAAKIATESGDRSSQMVCVCVSIVFDIMFDTIGCFIT